MSTKRGKQPVTARRLVSSNSPVRKQPNRDRRASPREVRVRPDRPDNRWRDPQWLSPPPRAHFSAGWALLPLRAFLGFTFLFAGLQKLANPAFFDASNPASIQSQMAAAALRSPIHALIHPLTHVAILLGVLIALSEVAVGLGTLFGLWTRVAAIGGLLISFLLFLTVSFHSSPYYTGSDIVFVFAWIPLIVAGAGGVLSADTLLENRVRGQMGAEPIEIVPIPFSAVRRVCGHYEQGSCAARQGEPCAPAPCPYLLQRADEARTMDRSEVDRRTVVLKGAATAAASGAALLGAGLAAGIGRLAGSSSHAATPTLGPGSAGPSPAPPTSTTTTKPAAGAPTTTAPSTTTTAPARPPGTRIGPARDVPVGGSAAFTNPSSQDPSLVVQPKAGTFLAFDAVCPHAGCTVQYQSASKLFVCPCHGSEFNGLTGAVEVGPAATGLTLLKIAEGGDGQLYVA